MRRSIVLALVMVVGTSVADAQRWNWHHILCMCGVKGPVIHGGQK